MAHSPSRAHVGAYLGPAAIVLGVLGMLGANMLPDSMYVATGTVLLAAIAFGNLCVLAVLVVAWKDIPQVNETQQSWNPKRAVAVFFAFVAAPLYATWYVYRRYQTFGSLV